MAIFPGLTISLAVFAFNVLGDASGTSSIPSSAWHERASRRDRGPS
jgi:ABC-type dipeptide/oligopeptide/nickel transport system permease subunit